jgi:hypothetical protein
MEKVIKKRNELIEMNKKQLEEFHHLQKQKKAEETKFALEANKGAEEKER